MRPTSTLHALWHGECLKEPTMLNWAITFLLFAIVASVFGFGGLAGTFADIAQFLAILFVILLVASIIYSMIRGNTPPRF